MCFIKPVVISSGLRNELLDRVIKRCYLAGLGQAELGRFFGLSRQRIHQIVWRCETRQLRKKYYQEHKEEISDYAKKYYNSHREKLANYMQSYFELKREKKS